MIVWITGQPGSGKTTIAKALVDNCVGWRYVHVDGDELRELFSNKDYSKEGRVANMEGAINLCRFLEFKGLVPVVSIVSPYKSVRDKMREFTDEFVEVYVHTDEIRGRENYFVKDYEPPTEDFLDIDTGKYTVEESVELVTQKYMRKFGRVYNEQGISPKVIGDISNLRFIPAIENIKKGKRNG